jgi:large repetitive protein
MLKKLALTGLIAFACAVPAAHAAAPTCSAPPTLNGYVNSPVTVTLSCTGAAAGAVTYRVATGPAHGTIALSPTRGGLSYKPAAGYVGTDSFTVIANAGAEDSSPITVNIELHPLGPTGAPTGCTTVPATTTVRSNGGQFFDLRRSCGVVPIIGPDVEIVTPPAHGSLSGPTDAPVYVPDPGYVGSDSFAFRMRNTFGASSPTTVGIDVVRGANHQPMCYGTTPNGKARSGAPTPIALYCFDGDVEDATFSVVSGPAHGTVSAITEQPFASQTVGLDPKNSQARAMLTYTATAGYIGSDSFTIRGDDGRDSSAVSTVTINVVAASTNAAPTCGFGTSVIFGVPTMSMTCIDSEQDALTLDLPSPPAHGTLSALTPTGDGFTWQATFTPEPGYVGDDRFSFRGVDSFGASSTTATTALSVVDPSYAPLSGGGVFCMTRFASTARNTTMVLPPMECTAPDHGPTTVTATAQPAHGRLTVSADRRITYVPDPNYVGGDGLPLTLTTASSTDSIVIPVRVTSNARATIIGAPAASSSAATQTFTLDAEPGVTLTCSLSNSAASVPAPCSGTASYSGTPVGDHVFTVTATDGSNRTSIDTYRFAVTAPSAGGGGGDGVPSGGGGGGGGGSAVTGTTTVPTPAPVAAPTSNPAPAPAVSTAPNSAPAATQNQDGPEAVTIRTILGDALEVPLPTIGQLLRRGASILFEGPAAGRVTIRWYATVKGKQVLVASGSAAATDGKAGRVKLTLSAAGKRLLRSARGTQLVTAKATFVPKRGQATTVTKRLTLRP